MAAWFWQSVREGLLGQLACLCQLVKGVGGRLIFFIRLDIVQIGVVVLVLKETVQIDLARLVFAIFIQGKQGNILSVPRRENIDDRTGNVRVVVQSQGDGGLAQIDIPAAVAPAGAAVAAAASGCIEFFAHIFSFPCSRPTAGIL